MHCSLSASLSLPRIQVRISSKSHIQASLSRGREREEKQPRISGSEWGKRRKFLYDFPLSSCVLPFFLLSITFSFFSVQIPILSPVIFSFSSVVAEDTKAVDSWAIGTGLGLYLFQALPALVSFATSTLTAIGNLSPSGLMVSTLGLLEPSAAPVVLMSAAFVALAFAAARGERWRTPLQLCVASIQLWMIINR